MTRVGVVLPAHNAEGFVGDALASIAAQSRLPDQVVVVDDGSRDRTAEIAARFDFADLEIVRQDRAGPSAARNAGLKRLDCDWVAFLDADDLWHPHKLACQLAKAKAKPGIDIWVGATEGIPTGTQQPKDGIFPPGFQSRVFFQLGAMLIRRRLFDAVGCFDEDLGRAEDMDWGVRAIEAGARMEMHRETVLTYRRHGSNLTNDANAVKTGLMQVLKKSIDRRRDRQT